MDEKAAFAECTLQMMRAGPHPRLRSAPLGSARLPHAQHAQHAHLILTGVCAGESHVTYFLLSSFKGAIDAVREPTNPPHTRARALDAPTPTGAGSQVTDAPCKKVLSLLCALYGLTEVLDGTMWSSLLADNDETFAQVTHSHPDSCRGGPPRPRRAVLVSRSLGLSRPACPGGGRPGL